MLYNILQDFVGSPLNTNAIIICTGINIKFLNIAKQSLEVNKEVLELHKLSEDNNILLEEILNSNKEIIKLLNIIISKIE